MPGSSEARAQQLRLVVRALLIAAALAILIVAAARILDLLVLVFGAVVIGVLIGAFGDRIAAWTGLPRRWGVLAALLVVALFIAAFAWLFGRQISVQFAQLSEILPSGWASVRARIAELPGGERILASLEGGGGSVASRIGSIVMTLAAAVTDFLLILFGSIFIALNPGLYRRGLVMLVPKRRRALAGEALADSGRALRRWMLGQFVSMALIGVLTALGLMLIGLPGAMALGLIAGLLEIIPYAGPILAAIPALVVGFAESPQTALLTLAVFLVVQQIEGSLIMPLVQKKAVSLPPALTVFGVVAFGLLFGTLGLIFAAPLLVVAYVLVKRLYVEETLGTETEIPGGNGG